MSHQCHTNVIYVGSPTSHVGLPRIRYSFSVGSPVQTTNKKTEEPEKRMTTTLLDTSNALLELESFLPSKGGAAGMKIAAVSHEGKPFYFNLGPSGTFPATVPFEPSSFGGCTTDIRRSMVLNVPDDVHERMKDIEAHLLHLCKQRGVNETLWTPVTKETTGGTKFLRAKVNIGGPSSAQIYDDKCQPMELPSPWGKQRANARLWLRGVYTLPRGCGPLLEVTHLQLQPEGDAACPFL